MTQLTQTVLFSDLTYVGPLKDSIIKSGGTVVFVRDNVILATEISEAQYRELLNSPYIQKMDILPIKRYGENLITYQETTTVDTNTTVSVDSVIVTTTDTTVKPSIGCPTLDMNIKISPKREMRVDDLMVGQNVYTIHEKTKKLDYFKIKKLEKIAQQIIKVSFNFEYVTVSESHKFLTENDEYVAVSDLSIGSKIKTLNGNKEITEILDIGMGTVMCIEIEDAHTYIVNGLISHNKQSKNNTLL